MPERIADIRITPIAFRDPPLLNVAGVHQPWALRSIIEIETERGLIGLGESYGEADTLTHLQRIAPSLVGMDPFHLNALTQAVYRCVGDEPDISKPFACALEDPPAGAECGSAACGVPTPERQRNASAFDQQAAGDLDRHRERVEQKPLLPARGGALE